MAVLKLSVITPERTFFDEDIEAVILPSMDGQLGVLHGHLAMTAALKEGGMRIKLPSGDWREAVLGGGFAKVDSASVLVFAQTAEWPEEVDIRRAREDLERAKERLRQAQSLREHVLSKAMIARAMARLQISTHHNID